MKNLHLKRFLLILFLLSAPIWYGIAVLSGLELSKLTDFLRPIPKVVSIDVLLVAAFVRWGWRWRLLQGWLVPFPDLNGTWRGAIQTSWKDHDGQTPGPIPAILVIKQSFLRVSCVMKTGEMESRSYSEGFCLDDDTQRRQFCYSYTSRPKIQLRDRSTPHDGTALLDLQGKPVTKIQGEYWTQRSTVGSISLVFHSKERLEDMPESLRQHPMSGKND